MKLINFKDKHLRLGGYSALITSILIVFLIVINMIFSSLDIKMDLTEEQFFSLSEKTLAILEQVEDPVTIYVLEETGKENNDFRDILNRYSKENSNISVVYKDPILYPGFAQQYLDPADKDMQVNIPTGSIIIENEATGKHKLLFYYELFNYAYNSNTGTTYVQSVAIEEKISAAIDFVTMTEERRVYVTSGHGEYSVPMTLISQLESENFTVEDINLLTQDLEHSPYNTLLIYSPHSDFSDIETEKIMAFLEAGGKAMIFTDHNTPELPNFYSILNYYGVELETGIVVEGSQNHMLSPYPTFILPDIFEHEITTPLLRNNLPIVVPLASGLKTSDTLRRSVNITPLLSSSDNSWLKIDPMAETPEKEEYDIEGPIDIAYLIEDNNTLNEKEMVTTKLLVISNTIFLDSQQLNLSSTGNLDFVMNSFLWLQDKEDSLYIRPKTFTNYSFTITSASTVLALAGISMVVMPLITLILGILTWLKRRHL